MIVQIDTREKPKAIGKILACFDRREIKHFRSKLPCGDYMSMENARFCIDRKQNLSEVCSNVCQQHKRFINELIKAREIGVKLVFLVEHGGKIQSLEDVRGWKNPRLKKSPLAVSGERLYKILSTIEKNYNTKFYFCSKAQTGETIIKLLRENEGVLHETKEQ